MVIWGLIELVREFRVGFQQREISRKGLQECILENIEVGIIYSGQIGLVLSLVIKSFF